MTQIIAYTYLFTFKLDVVLIGKILISGCKERYWPEMLHKVAWNKSSDLLQIVQKRDEKGGSKVHQTISQNSIYTYLKNRQRHF
jgi:hypothetical protein